MQNGQGFPLNEMVRFEGIQLGARRSRFADRPPVEFGTESGSPVWVSGSEPIFPVTLVLKLAGRTTVNVIRIAAVTDMEMGKTVVSLADVVGEEARESDFIFLKLAYQSLARGNPQVSRSRGRATGNTRADSNYGGFCGHSEKQPEHNRIFDHPNLGQAEPPLPSKAVWSLQNLPTGPPGLLRHKPNPPPSSG